MLVLPLALRALRWRAGASAAVFVVALVAVLAATIGPIYLHAVDEAVQAERLGQASPYQRDTFVSRPTLLNIPGAGWETDVRTVAEQAYDPRFYAAPQYAEKADVVYSGTQQFSTHLAAIQDMCGHVRMVSGRCVAATATDETIVSARTAAAEHIRVGSRITVTATDRRTSVALHIVGLYQPIDAAGSFWSPWDFFDARPALSSTQLAKLDSLLVAPATLSSRLDTLTQTLMANVQLLPAKVHLDDRPALEDVVARAEATARRRSYHAAQNYRGLTATSATSLLPSVLASMSREMALARSLITVAGAQLAVLAIFVLFAVVAGTSSVHGPEVALAKLRGRREHSVVLQGVLQPVVLIFLATPVAAVLAWVAVKLLAPHLLHREVDVVFPPSAITVAVLAAGGGVLATVLAARRIVLSPVAALLRRTGEAARSSLGWAMADAAAVILALAGIVQLVAGGELDSGRTNPLSAVTPALLALAGAIVIVRILPYVGRSVVRSTRDTGRLATFLAVRQIVRRPTGARALLLVAVAIALAAFAVTNWSAARTNRQLRALYRAGAPTVLTVRPSSRVEDLRAAVDRADPGGHSMAAAYVQPPESTPLLAVDTHRFAGNGAWISSDATRPLADVLARLRAPTPPPVTFHGLRLRLSVDVTRYPKYPVTLSIDVIGVDHQLTEIDFGTIRRGPASYSRSLPRDCRTDCRVSALSLSVDMPNSAILDPDTKPEQLGVHLGAQAWSGGTWTAVAGFDQAQRWRSDGRSAALVARVGASLSVLLRQTSPAGPWATLDAAAVPADLPAVVASGTAQLYRGASLQDASTVGLDGQALPIDGVIRALSLPRLDRSGAMVDFGQALAAMTEPPGSTTVFQVWVGAGAPDDMSARLAAQGVVVTGVVRAVQYQLPLDRTGPAFADSLFLVAAFAACVLALATSVLGGIVTARRRSYEFAALEIVGVLPSTLRRASAAEQAMLLGVGLAVGCAAGIGGSLLALPSTPFFVDVTVGPPRDNSLPWGPIALLAATLVLVFALTSIAVGRLSVRSVDIERLREAE